MLDLAQSIDSSDNLLWTIELKPGYTFTDGTGVDAGSFVAAWQHAASGPNAHLFAPIADLAVVDPLAFTVELAEPMAQFPALLGHTAFSPLSSACLADPVTCAEEPIGNGPYLLDGGWQHGVDITLARNPAYPDPGEALPDLVRFRIYPDLASGCLDVKLGNLDVMYPIPPECRPIGAPAGGYFDQPSNALGQLALPSYLPQLQNPLIRQALSLAIDRSTVISTVFDGRATAAAGLVSPHIDGFRPAVCGVCVHDPAWAQQLLQAAGGWPGGTLALWAPAGFGHEAWLTEVGEQLHDTLGIDYTLEVGLPLPDYLARAAAGTLTGPFWLGWDPDYPAMDAYLAPQFDSGGPANYTGYANPEVDDVLDDADTLLDPAERIEQLQQAESIVVEDLPVIPLWFEHWEAVYSANVDQFVWNLFNGPEYGLMTLQ